MKITGNTILITGGGSGIGASLAAALQAKGNTVVIAGRREDALRRVAEAHPGIEWLVADVSTAEGVAQLASDMLERHPPLNVLVNNAGIMRPEDVLADDYGVETAEATIATNLLAPIRLTAALLPHLRAQASAGIVNAPRVLPSCLWRGRRPIRRPRRRCIRTASRCATSCAGRRSRSSNSRRPPSRPN